MNEHYTTLRGPKKSHLWTRYHKLGITYYTFVAAYFVSEVNKAPTAKIK